MFSFLIAIIYLAFVGLGLPDSLLGSAWPVIHTDFSVSVSLAGIVSMITSLYTIISAVFTDKLTKKLGSGLLTALSTLLTAVAMMCFSFASSFRQLCIFAIPYGLGAGAIDACLNNFAATNLSSKHMSWLHCCWGIGAMISPYIMSSALSGKNSWHGGYRTVSILQSCIALVLFLTLFLWKKQEKSAEDNEESVSLNMFQVLRLKGTVPMFAGFMFYCAIEMLPIVWASTYFATVYGLSEEKAASFGSLFYLGMTVSRGLCGFISEKFGDRKMIRLGLSVVLFSSMLIFLPLKTYIVAFIGFIFVGIGCGPVYPSIVHETPDLFGRKYSGSVVGVQMAFAYLGFTLTPYIFGKISELTSIKILPLGIILLASLTLILTETVNRKLGKI